MRNGIPHLNLPMTIYLRIKRLRNDSCVVDSFEAPNVLKKPRTDSGNATDSSVFRYIGTQLQGSDSSGDLLGDLCKVEADGVGRVTVNSAFGPTVYRSRFGEVACKVQFKTLKRVTSDAHSFEDETPLPRKMFRIIDIVPHGADDPLPFNMDSIQLNASANKRPSSPTDFDFVYDLYRLEKRKPSALLSHPVSNEPHLWVRENEIVADHIDEEDGSDPNVDDEDDSNSESNWRNDYPDEEEDSQSESGLCSDRSSRLSSGSSSDEDIHYYRSRLYCAL